MRNVITLLMLGALAACGQTGKLYLPDTASDVVTRPAATPPAPAPEQTGAPNSPQTPDSQPAAPAPESKKNKGATPPLPR